MLCARVACHTEFRLCAVRNYRFFSSSVVTVHLLCMKDPPTWRTCTSTEKSRRWKFLVCIYLAKHLIKSKVYICPLQRRVLILLSSLQIQVFPVYDCFYSLCLILLFFPDTLVSITNWIINEVFKKALGVIFCFYFHPIMIFRSTKQYFLARLTVFSHIRAWLAGFGSTNAFMSLPWLWKSYFSDLPTCFWPISKHFSSLYFLLVEFKSDFHDDI